MFVLGLEPAARPHRPRAGRDPRPPDRGRRRWASTLPLYKTLTFGVQRALHRRRRRAGRDRRSQFVAPDSFTIVLSISFLVGVVVGGLASISGRGLRRAVHPVRAEPRRRDLEGRAVGDLRRLPDRLHVPDADGDRRRHSHALARRSAVAPRPARADATAGIDDRPALQRRTRMTTSITAACRVLAAAPHRARRCPPGAEEVRPGRDRHRDQDRQHQPVQRPGVGLRHDRQGRWRPTSRRSTTRAASTAARSTSSSLDDGYSPPKTVEQARKLVEQDKVLLVFQTLGTPSNIGDPQVHERARRCRSCSSPPAPPSGATRRTSRGPWAGSRLPDRGARSTPSTS